jgi:hypothetical protein
MLRATDPVAAETRQLDWRHFPLGPEERIAVDSNWYADVNHFAVHTPWLHGFMNPMPFTVSGCSPCW